MYSCGALATDMTRLGVLPPKALGTRDEALRSSVCQAMGNLLSRQLPVFVFNLFSVNFG